MTVLEIYEKVNLKTPVEQRVFFNYLNDSVNEIAELYGDLPKTMFRGNITATDIVPIDSLTAEMVVLPLYHNAVVDNILFRLYIPLRAKARSGSRIYTRYTLTVCS